MKKEQRHITYKRIMPQLLAEMKIHFENEHYGGSQTYRRVLQIAESNIQNARIQDVSAMHEHLVVIHAFAKLNGCKDLERYARQIIKLF